MTQLGSLFFKLLNKVMIALAVFWLGSSLFWLQTIAHKHGAIPTVLFSILGVAGLLYSYRRWPTALERAYEWLTTHKGLLTGIALSYQLILLFSATMMIRSDAAVVFNGATGLLDEENIASYLTRNPNNMALFLYERFAYHLFGSGTLWVLQALNMAYTHLAGWLLYLAGRRYFSRQVADRLFLFYWLLIVMTPKFMAMYSDILVLPLLAGQIYLVLAALEEDASTKHRSAYLAAASLISGLTVLIRPTAIIVMLAFFLVLFFKRNWRACLTTLAIFTVMFGASYTLLSRVVKTQDEVPLIKGEGLSKNLLTFINLGLTFSGTDQEDMQAGLAAYLLEEQREVYNNGRFKNDHQIAEIKRRLASYNPVSFILHTLYKQYLTTGQGNLNWIYKAAEREKTVTMSPLTKQVEKLAWAKWVRAYLIYTDQPKFQYYDTFIQWVWIGLSIGLLAFFVGYRDQPTERFLSLALFGGLLFLQIFEGGKSRYLIQFFPQLLLIVALGFDRLKLSALKAPRTIILTEKS